MWGSCHKTERMMQHSLNWMRQWTGSQCSCIRLAVTWSLAFSLTADVLRRSRRVEEVPAWTVADRLGVSCSSRVLVWLAQEPDAPALATPWCLLKYLGGLQLRHFACSKLSILAFVEYSRRFSKSPAKFCCNDRKILTSDVFSTFFKVTWHHTVVNFDSCV